MSLARSDGEPSAPAFLSGGGDMGARIRSFDWASTPLGAPDGWPQSLRSALSICLHSSFPTAIYWGSELRLIYNDAWAPIPAERHPWALGRPAAEVWADIWAQVEPQMRQVMETGEGFATYDQMLPMVRDGEPRETYWNYSFTPIRGEDGAVCGIFNQGNEVTDRIFAERRRSFLLDLTDRLRGLADPHAIIAAAQAALGEHMQASRVGYGEVDASERYFTTQDNWTDGTTPDRLGTHDLAGFGPDIHATLKAGEPLLLRDVTTDSRTASPESRAAFAAIDTRAVITASLVKEGRMRAALYVHSQSPRHWSEDDAALVGAVAERTWAAVERARAETALRASEERLRGALSIRTVGVMFWDESFGLSDANDAFLQMTGFTREEAMGLTWQQLTPPEFHDASLRAVHEVTTLGETTPYQKQYYRKDGSRWWGLFAARRVGAEVVEFALDIGEQKAAEAQLRQLAETLEAQVAERTADRDRMWRLSTDVMLVARFDATITAVNPAWTRLLGWSEDQLVGRAFMDLVHPDDLAPTLAELGTLSEGVTTFRFENRYRASDGGYRWISWIAVPEAGLIHAVGRDVTAEKAAAAELAQAQEALRQSQKMDAMGQLTGGVAHDFNNLLTPIVASLDMLQRRAVGGEREQRLIGNALQSAERAKTLVQRLLAFARRQPLQPTAVDIAAVVGGMAELIASTSGPRVRLELDVAPELPPARADANQVEMALLNLAVNARDAMAEGGTISISAADETVAGPHRAGLSPGRYVRLSVADTGSGMDAETLKRAIEPFFSTKGIGKGTGLGLSMVHGLAAQLGGGMAIRSRVGLGTSVELWLPVSREAAAAAERVESGEVAAGAGTALLVDDEELVRMSVADMLAELGYSVVEVGSAEEALRRIDGGLAVDLLVTDHLMPGLTGAELAQEVRGRRPGAAVLLVSGYAEVDGIPPDLPRLTKPFRRDELAASLAALGSVSDHATSR